MLQKLLNYIKLILRETFFWIFLALDIVTFLVSYRILSIQIPLYIYWLIALLGFFIANFKIYLKYSIESSSRKFDNKNLLKIIKMFTTQDCIILLREQDFGAGFPRERLNGLLEFIHTYNDPTLEFINTEIEKLRLDLFQKSSRFDRLIGLETFPEDYPNQDWNRVPKEMSYEDLERWKQITSELNSSAQSVCDAYDKLVKTARHSF